LDRQKIQVLIAMHAPPTTTIEKAAVPPSGWSLLKPYLFDIVGPFFAYAMARAYGAAGVWAMTAAGLAAAATTAINTLRRGKLDAVGGLVLAEIAASVAILILVRDPRLMLVRPSIYTAVAAAYFCCSAFSRQPLTYSGSRVMAAKGGPARIAAYERAWVNSDGFRRTHRFMTFAFGIGLAADSMLRVLIVYRFPIEKSSWLSNVPHVTAIVLMVAASAIAGRRFSRYVDEQM
jgi:hypothetical protein